MMVMEQRQVKHGGEWLLTEHGGGHERLLPEMLQGPSRLSLVRKEPDGT